MHLKSRIDMDGIFHNAFIGLVCHAIQLVAAASLGLLVGALLAEDALLVPYWRTLSPQTFYAMHPGYAPRLYRFFAPLTIAGPSLALLAALFSAIAAQPGRAYSCFAALLALFIVAIYFIYFKKTNEAFGAAAIAQGDLAAELGRWAAWHKARTAIGLVAFAGALLAL
jgi:Domain of unknown function (DUF1772)